MANKLVGENSPYLLQHAENPVDWYPWGPEALRKAKQEDKPIFLSIGYAACHWCHVMAHESFEDPAIAALMNDYFVNIKVDREERPDLDNIYMQAVVAMTGRGGWPTSVFLTPDGKPFYGGTYLPHVRRYNMPSFREVLLTIARLWEEDRASLLDSGTQIAEYLQHVLNGDHSPQELDLDLLNQAAFKLAQSYDWTQGGWGDAPKFPQPMVIDFLLRKATAGSPPRGDNLALEIATHALKAMAKGGMYDVVGGGFARYSTDDQWLVPHFEKMLYDNAQLALVYLHAFLLTKDVTFRRVCEQTLNFVLRELTHPLGGFYSSLDADSEGEEGKYYLWSYSEINGILAEHDDKEFFLAAYSVSEVGNFEGKNVLQRTLDDASLATRFGLTVDQVLNRLDHLHARLFLEREKRIRPGTDDKILAAWNALMLSAYAQAGGSLRNHDYLEAAQQNAAFLLDALHPQGRLLRSWRNGHARHNAYLEDYAALILGLLDLYQADTNPHWFKAAQDLTEEMIEHYPDPEGGFFDTRDDHENLLVRPKDVQDNATPSGNALAVHALLRLAAYTGRGDWRDMAEAMLRNMHDMVKRYPTGFSCWLSAMDFYLGPVKEVALLGEAAHPNMHALQDTLWKTFRPRTVAAISNNPPDPGSPPLIQGRSIVNDLPTAYVCQNFTCRLPVNDPALFESQLEENP